MSEEHILREVGDFLAVARGNDVDLSELVESEIISIRLFHRDELGQILLGQGSEEESVLDFVVPIEGTEEGFEFGVGQGLETAAFFYDFFRPVVHLLGSSAYQPLHVFVVVVFVKSAWRTGESEVWRCLIAIDDECGIVVEGGRFDDLRRQSLCPGYDMTVLARTYDFRPSDHTGADIDFVQHFFGEEAQTKERIRGDVSRNASEDGFVTVWLLVVCEELFEHRKLFRSEGVIEIESIRCLGDNSIEIPMIHCLVKRIKLRKAFCFQLRNFFVIFCIFCNKYLELWRDDEDSNENPGQC